MLKIHVMISRAVAEAPVVLAVQVHQRLRPQVPGGEAQVRVCGARPAGLPRVPPLPARVAPRRRQQGAQVRLG